MLLFQLEPKILDLCFTTHPDTVITCEPAPGLSDHDAVLISFQRHKTKFTENLSVQTS